MHILSGVVFAWRSIGYLYLVMHYLPGRVLDAYTQWYKLCQGEYWISLLCDVLFTW